MKMYPKCVLIQERTELGIANDVVIEKCVEKCDVFKDMAGKYAKERFA